MASSLDRTIESLTSIGQITPRYMKNLKMLIDASIPQELPSGDMKTSFEVELKQFEPPVDADLDEKAKNALSVCKGLVMEMQQASDTLKLFKEANPTEEELKVHNEKRIPIIKKLIRFQEQYGYQRPVSRYYDIIKKSNVEDAIKAILGEISTTYNQALEDFKAGAKKKDTAIRQPSQILDLIKSMLSMAVTSTDLNEGLHQYYKHKMFEDWSHENPDSYGFLTQQQKILYRVGLNLMKELDCLGAIHCYPNPPVRIPIVRAIPELVRLLDENKTLGYEQTETEKHVKVYRAAYELKSELGKERFAILQKMTGPIVQSIVNVFIRLETDFARTINV